MQILAYAALCQLHIQRLDRLWAVLGKQYQLNPYKPAQGRASLEERGL